MYTFIFDADLKFFPNFDNIFFCEIIFSQKSKRNSMVDSLDQLKPIPTLRRVSNKSALWDEGHRLNVFVRRI